MKNYFMIACALLIIIGCSTSQEEVDDTICERILEINSEQIQFTENARKTYEADPSNENCAEYKNSLLTDINNYEAQLMGQCAGNSLIENLLLEAQISFGALPC